MTLHQEVEHRGKLATLWHYTQTKFERFGYQDMDADIMRMLIEDWYDCLCPYYPDEVRAAIPRYKSVPGKRIPDEIDIRKICVEQRKALQPAPRPA